jgi:hypothetical protein
VAAPDGIVQQRGDIERDIERALPELVGEIDDVRIVGVGAVVIGRGDDVTVGGQRLGEPGVIEGI